MSPFASIGCALLALTSRIAVQAADNSPRPNLVYILADDLGYGDVSRLHAHGRIATPHVDRLAREGLTFTDAHTGSSVCTPTRYGLMTGRYAWRSRLKTGVLGGLSPRLIERDRMTVASLLRAHGYHTACIGKWHLGMDWVVKEGKHVSELSIETPAQVWNVEFAQPARNGPKTVGFDFFFGISASLDMVPYAYIENDRVTRVPDRDGDFPWFHGRPRRTRRGPTAEGFDAADVLGEFTRCATPWCIIPSTDRSPSARDAGNCCSAPTPAVGAPRVPEAPMQPRCRRSSSTTSKRTRASSTISTSGIRIGSETSSPNSSSK